MMHKYSINHFSHQKHSLKLYKRERKPWNGQRCGLCGFKECQYRKQEEEESSNRSRLVYGCRECRYMIHLDCAKLPQEVIHPFHSQHPLSLLNAASWYYDFWCHACGKRNRSYQYVYRCTDTDTICKFNLDLGCIQLQPNDLINNNDRDDQLFSHHLPRFVCNRPSTGFKSLCSFCYGNFSKTDLIYVCLDCQHLYHKFCIFPQKFKHPFHLEHPPLVFVKNILNNSYNCNACSKALAGNPFFSCSVCEFKIDLSCVHLKPTSKGNSIETDHYHGHPHDLIQCDPIKHQPSCSRCELPIQDFVYVCLECGILLHESCTIQLLPEITNPFHPLHTLTLVIPKEKTRIACIICHRLNTNLLQYECRKCDFFMDTRCAASVKPYAMVNSRMHKHSLAFLTKNPLCIDDGSNICVICDELCEKYYFFCPECPYYTHPECCPLLPQVIRDDCHCDPLLFTDSQIKDASDEDSEGEGVEFYCHACEDLRDLDDSTYYCEECHFVAHLQCVFPAILQAMEEAEPKSSSTFPEQV